MPAIYPYTVPVPGSDNITDTFFITKQASQTFNANTQTTIASKAVPSSGALYICGVSGWYRSHSLSWLYLTSAEGLYSAADVICMVPSIGPESTETNYSYLSIVFPIPLRFTTGTVYLRFQNFTGAENFEGNAHMWGWTEED